jgi:8-oxo-dGTP pyrophosphatase MutT (NUDIX family)
MMAVIDKLAWIHIVDRKILSTLTKGKDVYYIPGGKREGEETDSEALVREIKEELSVDLLPERLEKVGVFTAQAHGKAEGVVVRMTCYTGPYMGEICPASEIGSVAWLAHKDKTISSPVDQIIFDWLKGRDLID